MSSWKVLGPASKQTLVRASYALSLLINDYFGRAPNLTVMAVTRGVDHLLGGDGGPRSKGGFQVAPASVASWGFLRRRRENWLAKAISFTFECCLSDF